MAWKLDVLCSDAIFYIKRAQALESGDFVRAFSALHLNVFPAVLMVLHRLGLGWELAGKLWGMAVSTAVVLPLFGWVRRQFNERVAVAACVLYAVHPKLIEWSPELIRGPTFWFFFALSLYLLWRAVVEVRPTLFAIAGVSVILTALTRFEGLFLLIPMFFWCLWRFLALREARGRLIFGALLALMIGPLLLVLVNATALREHGKWETIYLEPLVRLQSWVQAGLSYETADGTDAKAVAAGGATTAPLDRSSMITTQMAWTFLNTMQRGLGPIFGLLMLGAMWTWRSVWARRDHQPIFWVGLAVTVGMWIHLWYAGEISSRYTLSIVIIGLPFAGLGLMGFGRWLAGLVEQVVSSVHTRAVVSVVLLSIIAAVGTADALSSHYDGRKARQTAGRWLRQKFGPSCVIAGTSHESGLVSYYAEASYHPFPALASAEDVMDLLNQHAPDAIVLSSQDAGKEAFRSLVEHPEALGIRRVDREVFGHSGARLVVLARTRPKAKVASAGAETKL